MTPTMADVVIGRAAEIEAVTALVEAVAAGRGGSMWVEGEPGIGKSALLAAGVSGAARVGQVFAGGASDEHQLFPLRVLLDALGIGPHAVDAARAEIAVLLAGMGSSTFTKTGAVGAAAERLLAFVQRLCATSPMLLVVDDMQWADEVSLSLWRRLHELTAQAPLLLAAACRPVPQRADVDRLRHAVAGSGAVMIRLDPLPPPRVDELVTALVQGTPGPALRRHAQQAAGNPLYLRELVDAWKRLGCIDMSNGVAELRDASPAVPESLSSAIDARLGFLSEPTLEAVRIAALLGAQFTVEHLELATNRSAADLFGSVDEAIAAGVLTPAGDYLTFRHPLIRRALQGLLSADVRAATRRSIARTLAEAGEPVETVAVHLSASKASDDWAHMWISVNAHALVHRAPALAVALLRHTLGDLELDDPRRELMEVQLVAALDLLGQYQDSQQLAKAVLERARSPQVRAHMAWIAGRGLLHAALQDRALEVTERALRDSADLPPSWRARLLALHANVLAACSRYDEAVDVAEQAEALSVEAGDRVAAAHSLHAGDWARYQIVPPDEEASLKTVDRAIALLDGEPDGAELRTSLLADRVPILENLGRTSDAAAALAVALIEAERSGLAPQVSQVRSRAADFYFCVGRWDDALAEVENLVDPNAETPATRVYVHGVGSIIAHFRDDQTGADAHRRALADIDMTDGELHYLADYVRLSEALSAERHGDAALALALLRAGPDPDGTGEYGGVSPDSCVWLPDIVRLAMATGQSDVAHAAVRACTAFAEERPRPREVASAQHCRGLLSADAATVAAAAVGFDTISYRLWRAQALEDAAVMYAAEGDHPTARTAHRQAIALYTALGASWNLRRMDARLREHGIRRSYHPSRPTAGWSALTPTEHTIAQLVAAGLSNPDIADELFISRRTVGTHVTHILTKLHANSRVDIAREAVAHSAVSGRA